MSTAAVLRGRFPRATENLNRYGGAAGRELDGAGQMAWFAAVAIRHVPHALRHYRKETLRLIAQIGMGTGAMAVIGGTVAIIGFVTLSGSSLVAIQGFASLGNIGVEAFTGFFAALINVRIAAPVVAGIAMAATGWTSHSDLQSPKRRTGRARRSQILRRKLDQNRRRRMEGHAGTGWLNATDVVVGASASTHVRPTAPTALNTQIGTQCPK